MIVQIWEPFIQKAEFDHIKRNEITKTYSVKKEDKQLEDRSLENAFYVVDLGGLI